MKQHLSVSPKNLLCHENFKMRSLCTTDITGTYIISILTCTMHDLPHNKEKELPWYKMIVSIILPQTITTITINNSWQTVTNAFADAIIIAEAVTATSNSPIPFHVLRVSWHIHQSYKSHTPSAKWINSSTSSSSTHSSSSFPSLL